MEKKEMLRFSGKSADYQGFCAVKHLYMELYESETAGILQRSDIEKNAVIGLILNETKAYYIGEQPSLIKEMTVADNLYTVRKGRGAKIYHKNAVYKEADRILREFNIDVDAGSLVEELPKTDIRKIELIKAYVQGYPLIVIRDLLMDYSKEDQKEFLRILTLLKERKQTFVITDYNIGVLMNVCDRIMIFENGRIGKTYLKEEFPLCRLHFKTSETVSAAPPQKSTGEERKEIFSVRGLTGQFLRNLSFSIYEGEIVSLSDLNKNERTDLVYYLIGRKKIKNGAVRYKGSIYRPKSILHMKKQGINVLRMQILADSYVFHNLTVLENVYIGSIKKMSRAGVISKNFCNFVKCEFKSGFFSRKENWDKTGGELDETTKWHIYLKRLEMQNPAFLICEEIFAINDELVDKAVIEFLEHMKKNGTSVLILSSNNRNLSKVSDRELSRFGQ